MSGFETQERLLAGCVLACFIILPAVSAVSTPQDFVPPPAPIPDFQSNQTAWVHPPGGAFPAVLGSPVPLSQDPAHPFVANNSGRQPTYRMGDVSNPNLKQWVKDAMKKDNDEVLAGKIAFSARQSCLPGGVPVFLLFGGPPIYFVQTLKEVLMIYEGDAQLRRIYLNVPHSAKPKPSWYGESVGHYEGDTLVVDTVGLNTKTVVDSYRTPHTEKLHVTERWRLINDGKTLEANIRVEDPDTFNEPWATVQRYQRGQQTLSEEICAENNQHLFDYHIPQAKTPDF
jgi:hypothetical protein